MRPDSDDQWSSIIVLDNNNDRGKRLIDQYQEKSIEQFKKNS